MKRRVLVAQALVHKPPVIVLDEPTAGVDVELRQGLWQFVQRLNREGHTVILTTHYLEEAEALCGRIAMLKQGRVVALDTTNNLLARFSRHTLSVRLAAENVLPVALRARASESNGCHVFRLAGFAEVEPLLRELREAACVIDDLRLTQADLEDVFVGVMQSEDEAGSTRGNTMTGAVP
jgi:ABC-2 type transport system ATP-binding protein